MDICQNHHSGYWRLVAFLILSLLFPQMEAFVLDSGDAPRRQMHSRERLYPLGQLPYFCLLSVLFWSLTYFPQKPHSYLSRLCFLLSGLSVNCQSLLSVVLLLGVVMGLGMLWTKREEKVREKKSSLRSDPSLSLFPP